MSKPTNHPFPWILKCTFCRPPESLFGCRLHQISQMMLCCSFQISGLKPKITYYESVNTTIVCNVLVHKYRVWTFEFRQRLIGHTACILLLIHYKLAKLMGTNQSYGHLIVNFPFCFFHERWRKTIKSINIHATIRTRIPAWFW